MLGCTCRGYMSISSSVQPDAKGHYPDTYLNIGGGKWSKGVAFINGFNLVQPRSNWDPIMSQRNAVMLSIPQSLICVES